MAGPTGNDDEMDALLKLATAGPARTVAAHPVETRISRLAGFVSWSAIALGVSMIGAPTLAVVAGVSVRLFRLVAGI